MRCTTSTGPRWRSRAGKASSKTWLEGSRTGEPRLRDLATFALRNGALTRAGFRSGRHQVHGEGAAFANLAGQVDAASQQLGQAAAERQAEAGSLTCFGLARLDLGELVEDELELIRRDPDPGVRHREPDRSVALFAPHRHRSPGRRELEAVGDQVG